MLAMFQNGRVLFMYYWENNFASIAESHAYTFNAYKFIYTLYAYVYSRCVKH